MFGSSHDDSRDSERDHDHDPETSPRGGRGSDRDDSPFASKREESFMPMTRRDVDHLYDHALRDTSTFLKDRDKRAKSRSPAEQALSIGEMVFGALLGGYVSQRFRATSGALPTGLLLGGVGYGAAHFTQMFGKHSEDVKNLAIGSALASAVIWAAGYGAVGAEKAQAKAEGNFPATGGAANPASPDARAYSGMPPQMQQQTWPTPAYQPAAPPPAAWPAPSSVASTWGAAAPNPAAASVIDFQNLARQRAA